MTFYKSQGEKSSNLVEKLQNPRIGLRLRHNFKTSIKYEQTLIFRGFVVLSVSIEKGPECKIVRDF